MRCGLLFIVILLILHSPILAENLPFSNEGIITGIKGNEVTILLNDASTLHKGEKIHLLTPSSTLLQVTKTLSPLKLQEPAFEGKVVGISVADLDGDHRNEIVIALAERLIIGRFDRQTWTTLTERPLDVALVALDLETLDLNGDNKPEILLTAVRGTVLASQIFSLDDHGLQQLSANIPWFLHTFNLPGRGITLLGQSRGDDLYGSQPFEVLWKDGGIQAGAVTPLPPLVRLHGCQSFADKGTSQWLCLDRSDNLAVMNAAGEILWQGSEKFGGKESYLEWQPRGAKGETRRGYIASTLREQDGLIVLPQNDGSRSMINWRKAERSRLVAVRWNGFEMEKLWESPTRDGYLADFAHADVDNDGVPEYLLAGTIATGLFNKERTVLFLWEGPKLP